MPAASQAAIAPLIPSIVAGIYEAVSVAIASTFWVGILAAIAAVAFTLFLPEVPMRATFEMEPAVESGEAAVGARAAAAGGAGVAASQS